MIWIRYHFDPMKLMPAKIPKPSLLGNHFAAANRVALLLEKKKAAIKKKPMNVSLGPVDKSKHPLALLSPIPLPSITTSKKNTRNEDSVDLTTSKDVQVYLSDYLLALKEDDCSNSTIRNYRSDINQFLEFLQSSDLESVKSKPKLLAFAQLQREKGLTENSIKRKLTSITLFKMWLKRQGVLRSEIPLPPSTQSSALNNQEVLSNPSNLAESPISIPPNKKRKQPRARLTLVINALALIVFLLGLGYFGYQQFGQALLSYAFPQTPTRAGRILSYQGRLTDSNQNPVNASTAVSFKLYDADTGGSVLWSSNSCTIDPDQDGIFSVNLGAGAGAGSDNESCGAEIGDAVFTENANVWLEVTVGSGAQQETLTPRQPIRTVAYAINAETLQGLPPAQVATNSSIPVMNQYGQIVLGTTTPAIKTDSSTTGLSIESKAINILTSSGSNGDITLSPDGTGKVEISSADLHLSDGKIDITRPTGGETVFAARIAGDTGDRALIDTWGNFLTSGGIFANNFAPKDPNINVNFLLPTSGHSLSFRNNANSADLITFTGDGRLGIGNATPGYALDVTGDVNVTGALRASGNAGAAGQVLTSTGSGLQWVDQSSVAGTNYWQRNAGVLSPVNIWESLNLGATATSSALVHLAGKTGDNSFINTGNFGIGTTLPTAALDIANGGVTMLLGADNNAITRTNNSTKSYRIAGAHYNNSEEPVSLFSGNSSSSDNVLSIGGGSSVMNTSTKIQFYTAANTTTTTGTLRMMLDSVGNVGINTSAPSDRLTINGGNILQTANGNPTLKGTYDTPDTVGRLYVAGTYAYLPDGATGLQILDISRPASPSLVGTYDSLGSATDVVLAGKYAYLADINNGLLIIDVSNPTSPTLVGTYSSTDAFTVFISGHYAYLATMSGSLKIIDISNPSSPSLVGSTSFSGLGYDVYVIDKYAYVAADTSGLQIIDISNPSSPSVVGNYNTSGTAYGLYVSGKYAYVADGTSGLQIINITNPTSPTLVGTYNTSGNAIDAYVTNKYAYVADSASGLQVIDISNPTLPSIVGTYNTSGNAYGVMVIGKYAYVADDTSGLQIIDINGADLPAATIGNIETNDLTVNQNADIGNNLFVRSGLNVGQSGIFSNGDVSLASGKALVIGGVNYSQYFIDGAGTTGQVWTSDASGRGYWADSTGGSGSSYTFSNGITEASGSVKLGGALTQNTTFTLGNYNTVFNLTGTGSFDIQTNGLSALFVDPSTGNVGIGTNTPTAKLSIGGSSSFISNEAGDITINAASNRISFNGDSLTNFAQASGSSGTTTNPTYSFNSDTNSGLFNPLADNLGMVTGGTERLRITDIGNVGIGTTSPSYRLTLQSSNSQASLGSNVLTNGDFASGTTGWTLGTNWAVSSGAVVHTSGSTASLSQNVTLTNGTTYQVDLSQVTGSAGSVTVSVGSYGSVLVNYWDTSKTFSFTASASGTQVFSITPSNDYSGSLDDFQIRAITAGSDAVFGVLNADGSTGWEARSGGSGLSNIFLGTNAGSNNTSGNNSNAFGTNALKGNTSGSRNNAFGSAALQSNSYGSNNNAFGYTALQTNSSGNMNNAFGSMALLNNTSGSTNTAIGHATLYSNSTGYYNNAFGGYALYSNTTGVGNNAIGNNALYNNTTGQFNNALGYGALYNNISGNNNVAIGNSAGYNNNASGNVFIGYQAGYNETGANKLYIANSSTNPPLIYGDFATGNIGLGTTSPSVKLELVKSGGGAYVNIRTYRDSTAGGGIQFYRARGTDSAPTTLLNNDMVSQISSYAYDGHFNNLATNIVSQIDGTVGMGITPGRLIFSTAQSGTGALTERMRIDSLGNVGIGTTAPNTNLTVYNGNISSTLTNFTQSLTNAGINIASDWSNGSYTPGIFWSAYNNASTKPKAGIWTYQDSSGTDLYFGTSNSYATGITNTAMVIDQSGSVGIGTSSPGSTLDVRLASGGNLISIGGSSAQTGSFGWDGGTGTPYLAAASGRSLSFRTNGSTTDSMFINTAGNVGINNTSPTNKLEVVNSAMSMGNDSSYPGAFGTGDYSVKIGYDLTNNVGVISAVQDGVAWKNLNLNPYGNVGLGVTSPHSRLSVAGYNNWQFGMATGPWPDIGRIFYESDGTGYGLSIGHQDTAGNNYASYLYLKDGGYIGIGNTTPATALAVGDSLLSAVSPRSTISIANSSDNSTLQVGQDANAKGYFQWIYNGSSNTKGYLKIGSNISNQPIAFQKNQGTVASFSGTSSPYGMQISNFAINNGNIGTGGYAIGTTWYATTNAWSSYTQYNGGHLWYGNTGLTAGQVISYTQRMTLSSNGTLTVYGPSVTCNIGNGTGATNCSSDIRLKENVTNLSSSLDKLMQLRPVTYNWKDKTKDQSQMTGLIAQEVQSLFPESVHIVYDDILGIDYASLVVPTIKAVQEQQYEIKDLQLKVDQLKFSQDDYHTLVALLSTANEEEPNNSLHDILNQLANLTTTSSLTLSQDFQVLNSATQEVLHSTLALAEAVIGKLQVGQLKVQQIVAPDNGQLQIEGNNVAVQLNGSINQDNSEASSGSKLGKFLIQNTDGQTVASIDSQGNTNLSGDLTVGGNSKLGNLLAEDASVSSLTADSASISGTLATNELDAESARMSQIESQLAQIQDLQSQTAQFGQASVSGTLYSDRIETGSIQASSIEGLQERLSKQIAETLQQPSLLASLLTPPATPNNDYFGEINQELGITPASSSGTLAMNADQAMITADTALINNYFEVSGTAYISNALKIGQNLTLGDGMSFGEGFIAYQPSMSLDENGQPIENSDFTFALQPSGRGRLAFMGNLMTLDEHGLVMINGNLKVAGAVEVAAELRAKDTLLTNLIKADNPDSNIQVQLAQIATDSAQTAPAIKENQFQFVDENRSPVASFSAQGDLALAGGLSIGQDQEATNSDGKVLTNKTAGQATLLAGQTKVSIQTNKVTDHSMIYITPLNSTKNQVLYVQAKTADNPATPENEGQFTVGFDFTLDTDVSFNWWIVN